VGGLRRRLDRLEEAGGSVQETPEEREKRRRMIREGAEQLNSAFRRDAAAERRRELLGSYGSLEAMREAGIDWSDEALSEDLVPPFEVAGDGSVSCSRDGRPVTTFHQTLAEVWYWQQAEWGNPGRLVHDEEAQVFYTPGGELALSRDRLHAGRFFNNL